MLITKGLLAADSESQYITFPFYSDCESAAERGHTADSSAGQWLQNKCLLKLSYFEIPSFAECSSVELLQ